MEVAFAWCGMGLGGDGWLAYRLLLAAVAS